MNEQLANILGAAARAARTRAGLTQAEVAGMVDIATMVYSRLERGKMLPSVPTLRRLCVALRVPADALLGLDTPEALAKAVQSQFLPQEDSPSVRRLLGLARKLDETQVRVLIGMATALLR